MMSLKVLNSLAIGLDELKQTVKTAGYSDVSLWLGETGSCFGGGAPGLSDSYVAGFMLVHCKYCLCLMNLFMNIM